jgi:hypothetical protein
MGSIFVRSGRYSKYEKRKRISIKSPQRYRLFEKGRMKTVSWVYRSRMGIYRKKANSGEAEGLFKSSRFGTGNHPALSVARCGWGLPQTLVVKQSTIGKSGCREREAVAFMRPRWLMKAFDSSNLYTLGQKVNSRDIQHMVTLKHKIHSTDVLLPAIMFWRQFNASARGGLSPNWYRSHVTEAPNEEGYLHDDNYCIVSFNPHPYYRSWYRIRTVEVESCAFRI